MSDRESLPGNIVIIPSQHVIIVEARINVRFSFTLGPTFPFLLVHVAETHVFHGFPRFDS
ncbi:MAG TPA: hypothetical protein VEH56_04785 [Candidatus Saccharimonadales bacterium]|nr:hypothetical protein [Candidatus Saccharimonadales bacterium]